MQVVQFMNPNVATRLAALDWVKLLHTKAADKFAAHLDELFPALLKMLSDSSDEVVRQDLHVMGSLSSNPQYFDRLIQSLVNLFASDPHLLERRGRYCGGKKKKKTHCICCGGCSHRSV